MNSRMRLTRHSFGRKLRCASFAPHRFNVRHLIGMAAPTNNKSAQTAPFIAASIHFLICLFVANTPSEGSWQWFPIFVIDLPASLIPLVLSPKWLPPLLSFGVVGSVWWYFVVRFVAIRFTKHTGDGVVFTWRITSRSKRSLCSLGRSAAARLRAP